MSAGRYYTGTVIFTAIILFSGCREKAPEVNYESGIFPDTIINIESLNTKWDDFNVALEAGYLNGSLPIVFSSNRNTAGNEFDLVYGTIDYQFGQTTGTFSFSSGITADAFFDALVDKFNTEGDDLGPYRFFSTVDGQEYMTVASVSDEDDLDIMFSKYPPYFSSVPVIPDPVQASVFNSDYNDAYLNMNSRHDTAYYCSDRSGNYNIYMLTKPSSVSLYNWFSSPSVTPILVDSLASGSDEKCPFISGRYMLFASDMDGGYGGFDIYYSVFSNGKWSSPVNMGEGINTEYNEYRPVTGNNNNFTNRFMIFSSDRPGGKGRYDLYFAGITLE